VLLSSISSAGVGTSLSFKDYIIYAMKFLLQHTLNLSFTNGKQTVQNSNAKPSAAARENHNEGEIGEQFDIRLKGCFNEQR